MKKYFIFILLFAYSAVVKSQNPDVKQLVDLLYRESGDGAKYWTNVDSARKYSPMAAALFKKYPNDTESVSLFRYCVFSLKALSPYTPQRIDSLETIFDQYRDQFISNTKTYNRLTSIYLSLGLYVSLGNDLSRQKKFSELGFIYAKKAIESARLDGDLKGELFALYKLHSLYNIYGLSLYTATHPYDPIEKRNQVGPIIEKYLLKADSCYNLAMSREKGHNFFDKSFHDPTIKSNLSLLYGHYYYNLLKSELYYRGAIEILEQFPKNDSKGQLIGTKAWNTYCRREWGEAIPIFKKALTFLNHESETVEQRFRRIVSDCNFGLTICYFELANYDSALFYGNQFLADTVMSRDYLNLSLVSSVYSEIYLAKEDEKGARKYLRKSKDYLAKSQNEAVVNEFIKEGETIMVNEILEKVNYLTGKLDNADRNADRMKLVAWFLIAGIALIGSGFFIYRIREIKSLPWQNQ